MRTKEAIANFFGRIATLIDCQVTARRKRVLAFYFVRSFFYSQEKRLPPVPVQTVALEPEQQVESAVAATDLPSKRSCSNAAYSARPRGKYLGSKGAGSVSNTAGGAILFPAPNALKIELLGRTQYVLYTFGNNF